MFINRLGVIMRGVEKVMEEQTTSKGRQQRVKIGPYTVDQEVAHMLEDMKLHSNILV